MFGAICDCKVAYWWNPYDGPESLTYLGLSTAMYAGIDRERRTAHIAFRGTDQIVDFLLDILFLPWLRVRHLLCGHAGFLLTWARARTRLWPWLEQHRNEFDEVVVTGHSLGGALALACAYEVHMAGFSLARCITIGAPRVYLWCSSRRVERAIGDKCARVACAEDLVATIPPPWIGYRHVAEKEPFRPDLLGESHLDDIPVMRLVDGALYVLEGGPLARWVDPLGGALARRYAFWLVFAGLASLVLGTVVEVILHLTAATSVIGPPLLFALVLLVIGFGRAHQSASYMHHVRPTALLARWEADARQGETAAASLPPLTWDGIASRVPSEISAEQQARLVKAFNKRFGGLDELHVPPTDMGISGADIVATAFGRPPTRTKAQTLALEFRRAVLVLLRLGFTQDEVNGAIVSGVIPRPAGWRRFYGARSAPVEGATVGNTGGGSSV